MLPSQRTERNLGGCILCAASGIWMTIWVWNGQANAWVVLGTATVLLLGLRFIGIKSAGGTAALLFAASILAIFGPWLVVPVYYFFVAAFWLIVPVSVVLYVFRNERPPKT